MVVNLTGQPYRMLEFLVERAGELVTREEIRDRLWPDDHNVDFDAAINVAARRIRDVLEEPAQHPVFLHTVRGRGYRFEIPAGPSEAPPEALRTSQPEPPRETVPRPAHRNRRLALAAFPLVAALLLVGILLRARHSASAAKRIEQFSHSGTVVAAAATRDGSQIAYADEDSGETVLRNCAVRTGACKELLRGAGTVLKILYSFDGAALFFGAVDGPSPGSGIFQIPLAGGSPRAVVRGTAWLQSLDPRGHRVLFFRGDQQHDELVSADLTTAAEQRVLLRYRPDRITAAALSPDGRTIAFWWLVSNGHEFHYSLMAADVRSGAETPLSAEAWPAVYPRPEVEWLPAGDGVVAIIHDEQTGRRQIQTFAFPPAGPAKRVTEDLTSYLSVAPLGHSGDFVAVQDNSAPQIWVLDGAPGSQAREITSGAPGYVMPSWLPDGTLLASGQGLWQIDPSSRRKRLVPGTSALDSRPVSSPDSNSIFFASRRGRESAIWRIGFDGSGLEKVAAGNLPSLPKISPDGRWLAYSAFGPDGIAIWTKSLAGGTPLRINTVGTAFAPDFSPDGKWIAGIQDHPKQLVVLPAAGGAPASKFPLPMASPNLVAWSPSGKALTYIVDEAGASNIWLQPVDGGKASAATSFDSQRINSFAWAADGRLAVSRASRAADLVVIHPREP